MKVDLRDLLDSYGLTALGAMARFHGIAVSGTKKDELRSALLQHLFCKEAVQRALASLSKRDRAIFDRLVYRGGKAETASLRCQALTFGLIDPPAQSRSYYTAAHDEDSFEAAIARLTECGLVFCATEPPRNGSPTRFELGMPGDHLIIPAQVLALLPASARELKLPPPASVEQVLELAPSTLQRDLYLYLRFARHNELKLTNRGALSKRHLAKLVEGLSVREPVDGVAGELDLARTFFVRRLLEDLALLHEQAGCLVPTASAHDFFNLPLAERVRRAYQGWLGSTRWYELTRLPGTKMAAAYQPRRATPPQVVKARQFVASLLAHLPAGQWIPVAHLCERAALTNFEFLLPRDHTAFSQRFRGYLVGNRYAPSPYDVGGNAIQWTFSGVKDDAKGWQAIEGAFIASILLEPLYWLGNVSLGLRKGELTAFKIGEIGGRLLRGDPPDLAEPTGQVVVQPNFQVFAFDPIGEHVLANLDRFAALARADKATEYKLTRESVYRAQQDGMTIENIVSFLEGATGRPLPQNVHRTLLEWQAHHERIVVRRGVSLVHAAAPDLIDGLLADPALHGTLGRRLTPTVALLNCPPDEAEQLVDPLLARGHLPAIGKAALPPRVPALRVTEDGRIAFEQALPSIYIWRRLMPLADQRDGALWLSPASVQKAVAAGLTAEEIIRQLAQMHSGPIPETLATRIKAWAKHWGDATLRTVTLLRLKDEQVLAELSTDPEIGPLLRPYTPVGALAIVAPASLDRLRAALEAKGISLKDED